MLEDEIRELRLEVRALREAIEKMNQTAATITTTPPGPPSDRQGATANNPSSQANYIDEKVAAHLIGVSLPTLRNWRFFRKGPPYRKIGKMVRYSPAELLAWVDGQPGIVVSDKAKR